MAAYINIFGQKVQYLSSDPDPVQTGQVWYNSTSNALKYRGSNATSAWATGGNLNTSRRRLAGTGVSGTAALAISGTADPPLYNQVESYNGSSWTEVADVNTAREEHAAAGTYTAALVFGGKSGSATANTETYNGSSWTEVSNLNTARQELTGSGATNTASIAVGGVPNRAITENWNGSSWTEVGDLNTGRSSFRGGSGTPTSALVFGGAAGPYVAVTESWNGSAWTEVADLNTAAGYGAQTIGDSNTSALAAGGYTGSDTSNTERWNGSSWTEVANIPVATVNHGGSGTASSGIIFGGRNPSVTNNSYEWTGAGAVTKTVSTS